MELISKNEIIESFIKLGNWMRSDNDCVVDLIQKASNFNGWFTPDMVQKAFLETSTWFDTQVLTKWSQQYSFSTHPKTIGLILAGNIPLVGLHDLVCVLISGNKAQIKLSSDDNFLMVQLINQLINFEPKLQNSIQKVEKLIDFDAVIATGNNNTSRYFDYYFGKYPHIIRKNRHSIAVLDGNENLIDLKSLGHDIFDYFGLGCRNVSKIYIPKNYDIAKLMEALEPFNTIANHHKYNNNYDYNKSIYLINNVKHYDNGFLLLTENESFTSPLAVLHFEYYNSLENLSNILNSKSNEIQCVVSNINLSIKNQLVKFGQSQKPELDDFADQINTMIFLESLNT